MPSLQQTQRVVDANVVSFRAALTAWLLRLGRQEATRAILNPLKYVKEIRKADPSEELRLLLLRFGFKQAMESSNRTAGSQIISPALYRDVIAGKPVNIKLFQEIQAGVIRRVKNIQEETKERARASVKLIMLKASEEVPKPSAGEIARRIRTEFTGPDKEGVHRVHAVGEDRSYVFSSERAAVIARTELAQAENAGIIAAYEATGVEEITWLAYTDGRSGDRHHERMNGKTIRLGEMFVLPSGARLRYPADPSGPIGETVNCRCSTKPERKRGIPKTHAQISVAPGVTTS